MRKLGLKWSLTGRLFALGLSWKEAEVLGAKWPAWEALEKAHAKSKESA